MNPRVVMQVRDLFLTGHTVEDVIAAGVTGGWGLNDVADLIRVRGWIVDDDSTVLVTDHCHLGYPPEVSHRGYVAHRNCGQEACPTCRESGRRYYRRRNGQKGELRQARRLRMKVSLCDNGTGETGAVNSDPALTARTLAESEVRLRGT